MKIKTMVEKKNQTTLDAIATEKRKREAVRRKANLNVTRDPSRLLQPTKVWVERERQKDSSESNFSQKISIPHRAIPSWRSGLQ